jgi:hypothetical protein
LAWLVGCAARLPETENIEAVAAAESRADGTVASSLPSARQAKETARILELMRAIDAKFPGPPVPESIPELYGVTAVSPAGILELGNGMKLRMDGIHCSSEGVANLSRVLVREDARIAFVALPAPAQNPLVAEIWLVTNFDAKDTTTSPTYNLVAESALMSGWCVPASASKHSLDARYIAISEIAARKRS